MLDNNLAIPQKVKQDRVTICPSNSTLSINLKEMKTHVHMQTCTQIFIAVLFIISRVEKDKYLSTDEGTNKMWHIHTRHIIEP